MKQAASSVLLIAVMAACAPTAPRGTTGGRIDPYRTTEGDRASGRASMPDLLEFSERTAETLAYELTNIPEIASATAHKALYLGDVRNHTNTPPGDFEIIQRRIRDKLVNSKHIQESFTVNADPNRMDRIKSRLVDTGEDLRQEGDDETRTARYDPNDIYLLSGEFRESRRGNTRRFYFVFRVEHLGSGSIKLTKQFDLAQR